jgi:hypothetical protein
MRASPLHDCRFMKKVLGLAWDYVLDPACVTSGAIREGWVKVAGSLVCILMSSQLLAACGPARETGQSLGDLAMVAQAVRRELGNTRVQVRLQAGKHLRIGVVNSTLRSLPDDVRRAKARAIAQAGFRSYGRQQSLETVAVAFVVHRSYFVVFNSWDATDVFRFLPPELSDTYSAGRDSGDGAKLQR